MTWPLDRVWEALVSHIDTRGEGIAVVVFNSLGWPRTDVAQVDIGFGEQDKYKMMAKSVC